MHLMAKYGVEFTFAAPVIKASSNDFAASGDWTPAAGDVKVVKDEAAGANIGTLPTAITTSNNQWKFTLSATEMQAGRITISVVDSATKAVEDQAFIVETYGNASAQHAVDFDDIVRGGMTALPNAAADAAGGLPISDAGGLDIDAKLANTNEITAARMGALTDWIDGGRLDLIIDAINVIAADWTDAGRLDAILDLIKTAADAIQAKTDNLPSDPADQSLIIAATDAITTLIGTPNGADVIADIATVLAMLDDARTEPGSGAVAANPDLATKIDYLFKWARNKKDNDTSTGETQLYGDDDTVHHHQTTTVSGTVVTKGEIGA